MVVGGDSRGRIMLRVVQDGPRIGVESAWEAGLNSR